MFGLLRTPFTRLTTNVIQSSLKAKICPPSIQAMAKQEMFALNTVRFMNRNARVPKKANRGKRPCCNSRRKLKAKNVKSSALRPKLFGFYF